MRERAADETAPEALERPAEAFGVDDVVAIGGRFYVRVGASPADENDRVLKHGESFAVFDTYGDILPVGLAEEGLYHEGTRHLSGLLLRIGRTRPLLLGSTAKRDNSRLAIDLTNPDLPAADGKPMPRNTIHLSRSKVLVDGVCYERIVARNFGGEAVRLPLTLRFDADFVDIFEVRGIQRAERGRRLAPRIGDAEAVIGYEGLDGVRRATHLRFTPAPQVLAPDQARWEISLQPGRAVTLVVSVACEVGRRRPRPVSAEDASARAAEAISDAAAGGARLTSSNERFNEWLERSAADLAMMTTRTPQGLFPYAGVPWFSCPFGRDALISALESLWLAPELARGVLRFLAAHQAEEMDPAHDAEPGKILHEMRRGEMAATGEIPFGRYYGSHDATPLFVMLAAQMYRRTADLELVEELWPNVERALAWVDRYADLDGDGLVEYQRHSVNGLEQQGWKDSFDSVFHEDGRLAEGPIALCELQGYAYAARLGGADLADTLGRADRAAELRAAAEGLRARFEEAFWDQRLGTYVLALDGDKRPCRVRTSNAGHCLMTGIAAPERAARVARTLLADPSFSGWGIRTVAAGEARYNPMSYHDGSVWPHDNAMIALGLARYGHQEAATRLLGSLFGASLHFDLARLPELFCGFTRRPGEGPTRYPVACSPQAWASGAVFMLIQACLGLEVDAIAGQVRFTHPRLPEAVDEMRVRGLSVGGATLDLVLTRQADGVGIDVARRQGPVEIVLLK